MKIFIDSAIMKEIEWAEERHLIDGVTTDPTLLNKTDRKLSDVIHDILSLVKDRPVNIEAVSQETDELVREGKEISKLAKNVVIRIPMTDEGLKAARILKAKGIHINITLVFSPAQALLAARSGAIFVSIFVGRLDDAKQKGIEVIKETVQMYKNYDIPTNVMAASVRSVRDVEEAALAGADIVSVPFNTLVQMYRHDLTDKGVKKYLEDWEKIPK